MYPKGKTHKELEILLRIIKEHLTCKAGFKFFKYRDLKDFMYSRLQHENTSESLLNSNSHLINSVYSSWHIIPGVYFQVVACSNNSRNLRQFN